MNYPYRDKNINNFILNYNKLPDYLKKLMLNKKFILYAKFSGQ